MKNLVRKFRDDGRFSVLFKTLLICILILLLLIPLGMIRSVVQERESTRAFAENDIVRQWGGEPAIGGPYLVVPYKWRTYDVEENVLEEHTALSYFLPRRLRIDGTVLPEERNRGIYEVTVFTADLELSGAFRQPDFARLRIPVEDVLWEDAYVCVELSDMRSIRKQTALLWNDTKIPFRADKGSVGVYSGEMRAPLSEWNHAWSAGIGAGQAGDIVFSFDLRLSGGRTLSFLPLGEENEVHLKSPWVSPSFVGAFLPEERKFGSEGFEASWYILSLARGYPQQFIEAVIDPVDLSISSFGVELMVPVDTYLKTQRSVKYGILFIFLPFVTFFLFEVFLREKIHPLQYLLVGFAICLFYLLLLSLSEHLGFGPAYLLASLAVSGLVSFYSCAALTTWRKGIVMAPVLIAAFGFLYVLLLSEDYALLIGSLGLFGILTAVMLITRKVDWYGLGGGTPPSTGPQTGKIVSRT